MSRPKIIVFAYSDVGHACLDFLIKQGEDIGCVFTHEDNPQEHRWFPSVRELADSHSIPVRIEDDLSSENSIAYLSSLNPYLMFSFYYRQLIPMSVLRLAKLGAYNMHGSFLPKYRGCAPVNWAVLNGETETGVTLHEMEEKPDSGDIVDQERVPIGPNDLAASVQARITKAAVMVLERQIENLKNGSAPRTPQNPQLASYYGRRTPKDGAIDWEWPATRIHNLVRALSHPYPGAFAELFGDEKTLIWKTSLPAEKISNLPPIPGSVHIDNNDRIFVTCGDGQPIQILEIEEKKT